MSSIGRVRHEVSEAMLPVTLSPTRTAAVDILTNEPFVMKNKIDEEVATPNVIAAEELDIGNVNGNLIPVENAAPNINLRRLGVAQAGTRRTLRFLPGQSVNIVHDEIWLFLQGRNDILTEANDLFDVVAVSDDGKWMMTDYKRASGEPVTPPPPPVEMFIYDVTNPINYVLGSGTLIASFVDLTSNNHPAEQPTTTTGQRADIELNKINGTIAAAKFINVDNYNVQGLLTELKNKQRLTYRFDFKVDAMPASAMVLRRVWLSQTNISGLTIQILGADAGALAGRPRITVRTSVGQTAAIITGEHAIDLAAKTNVLIIDIDMPTAQTGFRMNYNFKRITSFAGGGIPGWSPALERRFENVESIAPPQYGGTPNGSGTYYVNRFEAWDGRFTDSQNQVWWSQRAAVLDSPRQTLAITPPTGFRANKVWLPGVGGYRDIPIEITSIMASATSEVKYALFRASGVRAINPSYSPMPAGNLAVPLTSLAITNITQAAAAVVTIGAHTYTVNDRVRFRDIVGMVQMNGLSGMVTAFDATTITVNINSTAFTAYGSGGVAEQTLATLGSLVANKLSTTLRIYDTMQSMNIEVRRAGEPDSNAVRGTNRYSCGRAGMGIGASNLKKGMSYRWAPYPIINRDPLTPGSVNALPPALETGLYDSRRWTGANQLNSTLGLGHKMLTDTIKSTSNSTGTEENQYTTILIVPPPTDPTASKYYVGPCNEDTGGEMIAFLALDLSDMFGGQPQEIVFYPIGNSPSDDWMEAGSIISDGIEYVYAVTGKNWQNILNSIGQPGGPTANTSATVNDPNALWELSWFIWKGGEHEANDGPTLEPQLFNQEKANIRKMKRQWHTRTGQNPAAPDRPFIIVPLGRSQTNDNERAARVREAQHAVINADPQTLYGYGMYDIPLRFDGGGESYAEPDSQHYPDKSYYYAFKCRLAQTLGRYYLPGAGAFEYAHGASGPKIVSVQATPGTKFATATCVLDGGTKLLGYDVQVGGPGGGPWQPGDPPGVGDPNMHNLSGMRARGSVSKTEIVIVDVFLNNGVTIGFEFATNVDGADMPEIYAYYGVLTNLGMPRVIRDDTNPGFKGAPANPLTGQLAIPARQAGFGCPLQSTAGADDLDPNVHNGWIVATV